MAVPLTADDLERSSCSSSMATEQVDTSRTFLSTESRKNQEFAFSKGSRGPSTSTLTPVEEPVSATTSVSRSYSHLDYPTFMTSAFCLCGIRTGLQQPLNIALLRKQSAPGFQYQSTASILRHIYRHEGGARGIARGMPALTLGCASSEVVYLALLEYGREQLPFESAATRAAFAGYVSDGACRLLHIPLSIVAYRQMSQGMALSHASSASFSSSTTHCSSKTSSASVSACSRSTAPSRQPVLNSFRTLQQMYSERGLRTVFAGLGTTLVVGTQWSAVWWPLYGYIKEKLYQSATPMLQQLPPNRMRSTRTALCSPSSLPTKESPGKIIERNPQSGSIATSRIWSFVPRSFTDPVDNAIVCTVASAVTSASTAVIFNPFLVIRTNLQVQPGATLWSASKSIYLQRGLCGFYSGLYLSITTCVLDGALASLSYEYARLWADKTKWNLSVGD